LIDALADLIAERLVMAAKETGLETPVSAAPAGVVPIAPGIRDSARAIAKELVRQTLRAGFEEEHLSVEAKPMGGGNTADLVGHVGLNLSFVVKIDENIKLAEEARAIREIRTSPRLPAQFRERFPRIFAIKDDAPPYAYLMEIFSSERGYRGLDEILFSANPGENHGQDVIRLMYATLDALFQGYHSSVDTRLVPNLYTDYVGRIESRLDEASTIDTAFASMPIEINGADLLPWKEYLDSIQGRKLALQSLAPPFVTVVHGDPNPGNVRVNDSGGTVEIKFIDVKEWGRGDYLFDVAKVAHYLAATGLVEKNPAGPPDVKCTIAELVIEIQYALDPPLWVNKALDVTVGRAAKFAKMHGDSEFWELRYQLGMASNLLGLPLGRLRNGDRGSALVLYAEGLKWLDRFYKGFARV